jgi:hypothetical protein
MRGDVAEWLTRGPAKPFTPVRFRSSPLAPTLRAQPAHGYPRRVEDLGPPIAYTLLPDGIPVYGRDGDRIGVVDEVLADFQADVFDGLIIHTMPLPGRHLFAAAEQIDSLHERGVVLGVEGADLREREQDSERARGQDERPRRPLAARLARAWDRIARPHR